MNTFVSNFIQNHKSKVIASAKGIVNSSFQKINESLTKYKQLLLENNPRYDSLICAVTQDPTFISDQMADEGVKYITNCLSPSDISDDDARRLYDGAIDAITNNGRENQKGLTLTDAKGRAYNIIQQGDDFDHPVIVNGNKIYLSSSNVPSSISEAILYADNENHFHLNNVIRSSNFFRQGGSIVKRYTMFDKVCTCCYVAQKVMPTTINDGLLSLYDQSFTGDLTDLCDCIAIQCGITLESTTLYGKIDELEDYYISIQPTTGVGSFTCIWSLFSDLIESSTLNSAIASTIQAIQSFSNFSIEFFQTLSDKIGTKYQSVKTFFIGARDAFLKGGFTGLGTYILSYVRAMSTLVDDDGLMSFTDNSDLIPQEYIAGAIFNIISAIATLIGVIVTIFSRIIGIVITILGSLLGAIGNALQADADDTYAAIQDNDTVQFPFAPYALFQFSVDTEAISSDIITLFESGAELAIQEVPGGFIIMGPSKVDKDWLDVEWATYAMKYPEFIYKFYPSIVPHNDKNHLYNLLHDIDDNTKMFTGTYSSSDWFELTFNKDCVRNYLADNDLTTEDLCQLYVDSAQDVQYDSDPSSGRLKKSDQITLLTDSLMQNITWFILWAISQRGYLADWPNKQLAYPHNNAKAELYSDDDEYFAYYWTIPYSFGANHLYPLGNNHSLGSFYDGQTLWANLAKYATGAALYPTVKINPGSRPFEVRSMINKGLAIDYTLDAPARMTPALKTPKYNPDTFWFWIIFSAVVLVAVTVVAVVATLKIKKAINAKRAVNQANVESAWEQLKQNPTAENYNNYRKVVKKNNRWATLIGGTKYDYVNYWNGDVSKTNDGSTSGNILSGLDFGQSSLNPVDDANHTMQEDSLLLVKQLISG